ncbi:MAG: hypothetical protein ACREE9_09230 [Stellaceae bacterium]
MTMSGYLIQNKVHVGLLGAGFRRRLGEINAGDAKRGDRLERFV